MWSLSLHSLLSASDELVNLVRSSMPYSALSIYPMGVFVVEEDLKVVIQATCLGTHHLYRESVLVPHSYQLVLQ